MFERKNPLVIEIDSISNLIHFFTIKQDKTVLHDFSSFKFLNFDESFFASFENAVKAFREKNEHLALGRVNILLPNTAFITDTFKIPAIKQAAIKNSLNVSIEAIYKNHNEIIFNEMVTSKTKSFIHISVTGLKKEIVSHFHKVCASNQLQLNKITCVSSATANGALVANPKLKGASYLLVDIKEDCANFALVIKGFAMGFYSLPFGYNILQDDRIVPEDLLFNHGHAELLVLNAKEKARNKALTVREETPEEETALTDEEEFEMGEMRGKRKLPKFLQREMPEDQQEVIYENFRYFVKWIADFIKQNNEIVSLDKIEKVYVNMPERFKFLFEKTNERFYDKTIEFMPIEANKANENSLANLDLFGGLNLMQYNKQNTF